MNKFVFVLLVCLAGFIGYAMSNEYVVSDADNKVIMDSCKNATKAYVNRAKAEILENVTMTKEGIKETSAMLNRVSKHYYDFCVITKLRYGKNMPIEDIEELMAGVMNRTQIAFHPSY